MSIERLWAFAKQYFFHRSLPHGMVHWRYLLLNPPSNVRIHRQLWLLGKPSRMPISVFFLMELILWLRWVLFAAWFRSWKALQFRSAAIYQQEGINKGFQLKDVPIISISHYIPPADIYAFGLYRSNSKQAVWDYVFVHEAQSISMAPVLGLVMHNDHFDYLLLGLKNNLPIFIQVTKAAHNFPMVAQNPLRLLFA